MAAPLRSAQTCQPTTQLPDQTSTGNATRATRKTQVNVMSSRTLFAHLGYRSHERGSSLDGCVRLTVSCESGGKQRESCIMQRDLILAVSDSSRTPYLSLMYRAGSKATCWFRHCVCCASPVTVTLVFVHVLAFTHQTTVFDVTMQGTEWLCLVVRGCVYAMPGQLHQTIC